MEIKQVENQTQYSIIKFLSIIVKEIGIFGFIAVFLSFIFLVWATTEQKEEFIDKFILLKPSGTDLHYYFIILSLLVIIVFSSITFNYLLRLKKEEIKRISELKEELQLKLLLLKKQ